MPVTPTTRLVRSLDDTIIVGSVTGPHSGGQWIARARDTGTRHKAATCSAAIALLRQLPPPPDARRNHPAGRQR